MMPAWVVECRSKSLIEQRRDLSRPNLCCPLNKAGAEMRRKDEGSGHEDGHQARPNSAANAQKFQRIHRVSLGLEPASN